MSPFSRPAPAAHHGVGLAQPENKLLALLAENKQTAPTGIEPISAL